VLLPLFVLVEVNYPQLTPQARLAGFALLGFLLIFLRQPDPSRSALGRVTDWIFAVLSVGACSYVLVQSEPLLQRWWLTGESLGERAGAEQGLDIWVILVQGQGLFKLFDGHLIFARFIIAKPQVHIKGSLWTCHGG